MAASLALYGYEVAAQAADNVGDSDTSHTDHGREKIINTMPLQHSGTCFFYFGFGGCQRCAPLSLLASMER